MVNPPGGIYHNLPAPTAQAKHYLMVREILASRAMYFEAGRPLRVKSGGAREGAKIAKTGPEGSKTAIQPSNQHCWTILIWDSPTAVRTDVRTDVRTSVRTSVRTAVGESQIRIVQQC